MAGDNEEPVNDARYIHIPLHLIGDGILENQDQLNEVIGYGIVRYASTFAVDKVDVYRQIIFLYYAMVAPFDNKLPEEIYSEISYLIESGEFTESDTKGYNSDGDFVPEENIDELLESWGTNSDLYKKCVKVYQLHLAANSLNITLGSCDRTLKSWQRINAKVIQFEEKYGKDALTSISMLMAFDYRDNDKDHYEIALLKAFLAIKSLQGKSKLCETNKAAIVMRMTGSKNKEVYKDKKRNPINKRLIERFNKRYHIDKLLDDLLLRGFIQSKFPNNRSLFISTSLPRIELVKAAVELTKNKQLKKKKADIKKAEIESKTMFDELLQNA